MAMLKALIRRFWKPLLASCATCALGIAVLAGLSGGCLSIETSTYDYVDKYRYYDACITIETTTEDQAPALKALDGVAHAESRMVANTVMLSPSERHLSVRALTYTPHDWQRFVVWQEVDAKGQDAVSLEYDFAMDNGISAGDEVRIRVGDEYRSYVVKSLVSTPETLSVRAYDNVSTLNSDFGYVYVPISLVAKEPNAEQEKAQKELDERGDELDKTQDTAQQTYDKVLQELNAAQSQLDLQMGEAQSALAQVDALGGELDKKEAIARRALKDLNDAQSALESNRETLVDKREGLVAAQAELENAVARLEEAQQALAQIDSGLSSVVWIRDTLTSGTVANAAAQLSGMNPNTNLGDLLSWRFAGALLALWNRYSGVLSPYLGGVGEVNTVGDLLSAYYTVLGNVNASVSELEANRAAITNELASYGISEGEIGSAIQQQRASLEKASEGLSQVDAALAEIDQNLPQLAEKQEQLDAALDQIYAARAQLQSAQAQAVEGQGLLNDLQAQLNARRQQASGEWAKSMSEFSGLGEELRRAMEEMGEWRGYQVFHNQYLLWFEDGADPWMTLAAAEAALKPTEIKSSFVFEDSAVKNRLDSNFVPLRTLSYFVPTVFFGVVLIVVFLFMSLIVRHSRTDIGILRALGKSTAQVRGIFCALGLLVTACAVPLGIAIGWGVMRYISEYFADFFRLPTHVSILDGKMLATSIVLSILVVQLATLVGTSLVSNIEPSEAISRALPAATSIPRVVQRLTSRLDELSKFSVLSLLRNPLRVCFSVVCMAASVAMVLSAQSFLTSKDHLVYEEFTQRLRYDCQIFLTDEPSEELLDLLKGLDYVSDVEVLGFYSSEVSNGTKSEKASVNALERGSDLVGIYDERDRRLDVPEEGIILERHLADSLGVGVGDTVYVDSIPYEIQALSDQGTHRIQYLSLEQAEPLGSGDLGCVIFNIAHDDQQRLLAKLTERDDFVFAVFTDVLYESNVRLHATYDVSAWILTSFAVVIGALVIFNVTQTNLLERKRELCVLRTLGFDSRRLSVAMFAQTLLHVGLSLVLGLPLGKLIAEQAFLRISSPDRSFEYANGVREYLITAAIVLAYAAVTHLLAMRTMRSWDINEGVRDKE